MAKREIAAQRVLQFVDLESHQTYMKFSREFFAHGAKGGSHQCRAGDLHHPESWERKLRGKTLRFTTTN